MDWIYAIITLLSIVAAILGWTSKLWWAKEYRAAKEAQIEALKTQIENLKELNPVKMREFFEAMKTHLGENIDWLQSQLDTAKAEIIQRSTEIDRLSLEGDKKSTELQKLQSEKKQAEDKVQFLTGEVKQLRETFQVNITQLLENLDKMNNYTGRYATRYVSRFGNVGLISDLIEQYQKLQVLLYERWAQSMRDKEPPQQKTLDNDQKK